MYKGVGAARCSGPHHGRMTALIHKVIESPTKFRHFTSLLSELLQEFHHRALKRLQNFSLGTSPNGAASSLAGACWIPPHPRSCPKPTPEKQGEHITEPRRLWNLSEVLYESVWYTCLILSYLVCLSRSRLRDWDFWTPPSHALSAGKDASALRTSEDARRPRQTSLEAPEWIFTAWLPWVHAWHGWAW